MIILPIRLLAKKLAIDEKLEEIDLAKTQFDFTLQEKEKEMLSASLDAQRNKVTQRNRLLVLAIVFAVGLVAFAGYWYHQHKVRKQQNQRISMLMQELHHRVKNNLQVISSLLSLQSMKLQDDKAKQAVLEGKNRVKAMSMIHQKLYQSYDLSEIDFRAYVKELVEDLKRSYMPKEDVDIVIDIPDLKLDVEKTLPLGLIINELVSNSFKYAFQGIETPQIGISLMSEKGGYLLKVFDNGPGLPRHLNPTEVSSFGLRLVKILSDQMKGSMSMDNRAGLHYEINFAS